MYLLKLALRPWRVAPVTQLFSCGAVGLLLLLAGMLFWLQRGLGPLVLQLTSDQVLTAYVSSSVKPEELAKLRDAIKGVVGDGAEVRIIGAQGFVNEIKKSYPELSRQLEDLGSEVDTVVPTYVSVSGALKSDALMKIRSIQGVEAAESSRERFSHIVGAFKALRKVAIILGAGTCLALLAGLIQLARMNSLIHADALSVLRLWGAGTFTLRMPGALVGMGTGVVGGAFAASGWLAFGRWLSVHLKTLSPMLTRLADPDARMAMYLVAGGLILGLVSGLASLGSTISSREARG